MHEEENSTGMVKCILLLKAQISSQTFHELQVFYLSVFNGKRTKCVVHNVYEYNRIITDCSNVCTCMDHSVYWVTQHNALCSI